MAKRLVLILILLVSHLMVVETALVDSSKGVFVTSGSMSFDDNATLDTTQVVDIRPYRADWDHALAACLAAGYTRTECYESLKDGEF